MPAAATIELLAPAGEPRALRAALSAGADAVYFGLERWSARAFAGNFAGDAVVAAVELAHLYSARAYLALNTLLKDDEVGPALEALEAPYVAGLDALIVADLGLAAAVREQYPELPLHASTQLSTHSSAQLEALGALGFSRAVLARELSLAEIAALAPHGLELEAFVHGALCYGYSGDCLLSSMVGGRSGNRGRCSQACRMRYTLRPASGEHQVAAATAGEATRVMSTSDLAAIGALPALLAAGVSSFKIEGRMKDADYVGITTAVYREALDAAVADPEGFTVRPEWLEGLEQSFSRSFTTAHLDARPYEVRSGGRGGHRGVLVGRVARVDEDRGEAEIRLSKPVAAGDLVYLYTSWGQTEPVRLETGGEASLTLRVRERVGVKDRLFRLAAADAGRLARDLSAGRMALRPLCLRMRLSGQLDGPAALEVRLAAGSAVAELATHARQAAEAVVTVESASPLAAARTAVLTADKAIDALGALGGTPYRLEHLDYALGDGLFLAVAELKDLRRRALADLDERRIAASRRARVALTAASSGPVRPSAAAPDPRSAPPRAGERSAPQLVSGVVLVLRPGETPLDAPGVAALCLDVDSVYPGVEVLVEAEAARLRDHELPLRLRLPEILFDGDVDACRGLLERGSWAAVHVRNFGLLRLMPRQQTYVIEYPVQGIGSRAAGVAAGLAGRPPAAVVASPESALPEIAAIAGELGRGPMPIGVELVAFGRQQVLRTRDQLGRAEGLFEEPGPGHTLSLELEDTRDYVFPAEVDAAGTRLYNARVVNLAGNLGELADAGVSGLLVVQADLDAGERTAFAAGGLPALAGHVSRERSTTGHLFRGVA